MPTTPRSAADPRGASRVAIGAFGLMVVAATSAITWPADGAQPLRGQGAVQQQQQQRYSWSPAQVGELIAAIEDSRRHGLDPADYGLAALRGELELCAHLWGTAGSVQLDTLARAAALALASDYRRPNGARRLRDGALVDGLDTARRQGRLRAWLAAQARS